jgi:hypothetical protein
MRTVRSENEAPVLAILPATDWLTLLPRFSPTARSMLRNRRDLDAEVSQALNSFGTADFGIAADAQLLAEELRPASPSTASDPVEPAKAKFANSWRVSTLSSAKAGSSPVWSGSDEDDRVQDFRFGACQSGMGAAQPGPLRRKRRPRLENRWLGLRPRTG